MDSNEHARYSIRIKNLPLYVDQSLVLQLLGYYKPKTIDLDSKTGSALLYFDHKTEAQRALISLQKTKLCGKTLSVSWNQNESKNTSQIPIYNTISNKSVFSDETVSRIVKYLKSDRRFFDAVVQLSQTLGVNLNNQGDEQSHDIEQSYKTIESDPKQVKMNQKQDFVQTEAYDPFASSIPPLKKIKTIESDHPSKTISSESQPMENKALLQTYVAEEELEDDDHQEAIIEQPKHIPSTHLEQPCIISAKRTQPKILISLGMQHQNTKQQLKNTLVEVVPFESQSHSVPAAKEPLRAISIEELSSNRIAIEDLKKLPKFSSWEPGSPSSRLYVKNLDKKSTEADLRYIFARYAPENLIGHESPDFSIKLMTKGRLKGQAFIILPSVQKAQAAMNEVNGYVLHDRPMILAYGKQNSSQISSDPSEHM